MLGAGGGLEVVHDLERRVDAGGLEQLDRHGAGFVAEQAVHHGAVGPDGHLAPLAGGRDGDAALFDPGLVSGEGDVAARPVDGSLHIKKAIRMSHGFPSSISG